MSDTGEDGKQEINFTWPKYRLCPHAIVQKVGNFPMLPPGYVWVTAMALADTGRDSLSSRLCISSGQSVMPGCASSNEKKTAWGITTTERCFPDSGQTIQQIRERIKAWPRCSLSSASHRGQTTITAPSLSSSKPGQGEAHVHVRLCAMSYSLSGTLAWHGASRVRSQNKSIL